MLYKKQKICTLFRGISITLIIFVIYILQYYFSKYFTIFSLRFSTLNASHNSPLVCVTYLPYPLVMFHWFVNIKQQHYCTQFCIQREPNSLCTLTTVVLHCADSGEVPHTEGSRWLHDPSHRVPTLAITIESQHLQSPYYQSAVLYNNSLTLTLLHKYYYQQLNSNLSLTLHLRHTLLYTIHAIPRPIHSVSYTKVRDA